MMDATDIKAHPTASSLNKGGVPRLIGGTKGGMTSKLHGVCDSKGGPLRLHLSEGQCSKKPVHYSKRLDRKGHKIETLFSSLKDWQPIATRYGCCAHLFRSAILLAATVLF